jgi:glycosyltransferase involved in cell wall biosynthesis
MIVRDKRTGDPNILAIPNDSYRNFWARSWHRASYMLERLPVSPKRTRLLRNVFGWIGEPGRKLEIARGHEDFASPATRRILELGGNPDIVHCFNLHGQYFDLRELPWLSRQRPVILDLRDAWLLSGHCAHSFDCDRWKTGCGECPDLRIYPALQRDGTAFNWKRKSEIYAQSRLHISTPCRWLMQKVEQSMLAQAVSTSRVVPTGVDLSVFHPGDKSAARALLNLPQDARVLVFASHGVRHNIWRNYDMLQKAVVSFAKGTHASKTVLVALGEVGVGEHGRSEKSSGVEIRFVPRQGPETVAAYCQAADLYIHAARADTFPRAVLEALACGTPVIATSVGGIPEQVNGLTFQGAASSASLVEEPTGALVPPGDSEAMAAAIQLLLGDDSLRQRLSRNAARDAQVRFDVRHQVKQYLDWYHELVPSKRVEPEMQLQS